MKYIRGEFYVCPDYRFVVLLDTFVVLCFVPIYLVFMSSRLQDYDDLIWLTAFLSAFSQ